MSAKGIGKGNKSGGKKSSHYEYNKRCEYPACKKKGKYIVDGKYLCKIHVARWE